MMIKAGFALFSHSEPGAAQAIPGCQSSDSSQTLEVLKVRNQNFWIQTVGYHATRILIISSVRSAVHMLSH
jgi:hypothetical protein